MFRLLATSVLSMTFIGVTAASAQQATYGVRGFYGGGVEWGYNPQFNNNLLHYPNGVQDYSYSGSFPFSASASGSVGQASAGLSISATPEFGNIGLHALASANYANAPNDGSSTGAWADFDLYAYDTFHIGGSSGVPAQFGYTLTLDGTATAFPNIGPGGSYAYGGLELLGDESYVAPGLDFSALNNCSGYGTEADGNPCGLITQLNLSTYSSSPIQTFSGTLTLFGGTSLQLGEVLWARIAAGEYGSASGSALFDASNTGFFTLTPISPGATFTTDSGLNYENSPDVAGSVPEPATWATILLGFASLGLAMRRKRGRSAIPQLA